jgi:uncharacterized protein
VFTVARLDAFVFSSSRYFHRFALKFMDPATTVAILIAGLIFVVALLYSTVGHAGASGYLAAMALFGMAPVVMKPTALTLNILVALIGTVRFYRAGFFAWRTFWPFVVTSIPASFVGGSLMLPDSIYKSIVGLVLLYSAVRLFFSAGGSVDEEIKVVPIWVALVIGAVIGLLSGLTGVGGGIFLSPVLLLMHWSTTKETSGVSAAFILVNSVAGLLGHISAVSFIADGITYWAPAALIGGWIGTELGTRWLPIAEIRRWLSVVLLLAGVKLLGEAALILIHR